jgi:serine/threonine protein kinase
VFYELVTGRKPYTADTPAGIMLKQVNDPLPRPRQYAPDLPDGVEKAILKAMAKKPENRYSSMEEFVTSLEALMSGQNKRKEPTFSWRKGKAEKSLESRQENPPAQEQAEDQSTLDARYPVEVKPVETVSKKTEADQPKVEPVQTLAMERPQRWRRKIAPAWILAPVGLFVVIAIAVWKMPSLAFRTAQTPLPSDTVISTGLEAVGLNKALVPTSTETMLPSPTTTFTPTTTLTLTPTLTPTVTPIPLTGKWADNFTFGCGNEKIIYSIDEKAGYFDAVTLYYCPSIYTCTVSSSQTSGGTLIWSTDITAVACDNPDTNSWIINYTIMGVENDILVVLRKFTHYYLGQPKPPSSGVYNLIRVAP